MSRKEQGIGRSHEKRILVPGKTCWRRPIAERLAFLIDAAEYFPALESALRQAKRQILIIAWDFFSRLKLLGPEDEPAEHLGIKDLLENLLEERDELDVHLVLWDPALIYVHEREFFPRIRLGRSSHPRFHFHLDVNFPPGVSQHQKFVVIDDSVAFLGGIDLTTRRWDTREHRPGDPRRSENGNEYRPFHDLQVLLSGEAARDLGDLARERIRNAGRTEVPVPEVQSNPWPKNVEPELYEVPIGIARTQSAWEGAKSRQDILEIYHRAIQRARCFIYIENQHFSSYRVTEMLRQRLREPSGPEVVMVLPRWAGGWLEHGAMGTQRARMAHILEAADKHDRLRIYYPHVDGLDAGLWIHVHSKVLIVDDMLAMVGSSNVTNRSLSLDTEVDVAFESGKDHRLQRGTRRLLDRLLAEHLGTTVERVRRNVEARNSLIGTIDSLAGGERTLKRLDPCMPALADDVMPDGDLFDPEQPVNAKELVAKLAAVEDSRKRGRPLLRTGLLLLAVAVLAGLWQYTPVSEYLEPELLVAWAQPVRESPFAPVVALGVFVAGGLVAFPVLVLILATGIAFGPIYGLLYALLGCMLSALVGYAVGRKVGEGSLRRLAGTRIDRVSRALARRGVLSVAAIRLVPLAPFTVVNMAAGASHIRLWDYMLGTLMGMLPGIVAITVFGHGIAQAIGEGRIGWIIAILMIPTALLLLGNWIRKMRGKRTEGRKVAPPMARPEPQETT